MRRLAVLALVILPLAACSGEQGERAQQLLTRAQAAQVGLTSASFDARMSFSADGQNFGLVIEGGGYLKGRRAGDGIFSLRTAGVPDGGSFTMHAVVRRGQVSMTMNGRRFSMPVPAEAAKQQFDWSGMMVDLAGYVQNVRVREGRVVNGERGATVAGVIDTKELLHALLELEPLAKAAGASAPDVGDFADDVGDIHAALFIAQRTGLIRSAVINLAIEAEGKKAKIDFTYRLKSTNTAVPGL